MDRETLQEYLAGVLRIELDVYIQNRTIAELTRVRDSLCLRKRIGVPQLEESKISLFDCVITAGILSGIAAGLLGLIRGWCNAEGLLTFISSVVVALFLAVGGLLAGGAVLGIAAWLVLRAVEKRKREQKLQTELARYEAEVEKQNQRIRLESVKRSAVEREIASLRTCYIRTRDQLSEVYSYGIIDPEYRNIYAVSSFYGYVSKGRTHGLEFDPSTGDQGAYNLYESERRLNRIITNTDEILSRLDQVIHNQKELADGLQRASCQVRSLCDNVTRRLSSVSNSVSNIERCQSMIAYQTECNTKNLAFLTWIHTVV